MVSRIWVLLAVAAMMGGACSARRGDAPGAVVVAITVDWEGAAMPVDDLDALDELRRQLGQVPLTHFVAAAYFVKPKPDPAAGATLARAVKPGDELAVHLHGWRSLARAAGVEPRLSPSFLTGTDQLLAFDDGDVGFDTDLDAYAIPELRALLRTSRRLLTTVHAPVSTSFRAGGYLATPKVLQAIRAEGFAVDSSATDFRRLDDQRDGVLGQRVHAIWPGVEPTSQPWRLGGLLELPIAAIADYATVPEITAVIEAAGAQLRAAPGRDVFVGLAFHLETAAEFAPRLTAAIAQIRKQPALASQLVFVTIEAAAARLSAAAPAR